LVGHIAGIAGKLPKTLTNLSFTPHLLERVVGAKDKLVVDSVKLGEYLMLNVNAAATVGMVKELSKNKITCELKRPVAADKGNRITISRSIGQRWRLIGWGLIVDK
ncbi:MAG: translation initiation factor IF-2 subunit gamma, partial [Candidatus Woesearchaeota archaeon]|nr:translation initiation factor IF-2 subunit gamma [Candidatus Woesearchaeota archaeon]